MGLHSFYADYTSEIVDYDAGTVRDTWRGPPNREVGGVGRPLHILGKALGQCAPEFS